MNFFGGGNRGQPEELSELCMGYLFATSYILVSLPIKEKVMCFHYQGHSEQLVPDLEDPVASSEDTKSWWNRVKPHSHHATTTVRTASASDTAGHSLLFRNPPALLHPEVSLVEASCKVRNG